MAFTRAAGPRSLVLLALAARRFCSNAVPAAPAFVAPYILPQAIVSASPCPVLGFVLTVQVQVKFRLG
jgi:hypothetical protein